MEAPRTLPENAHRELKPGETYEPVIAASEKVPEVTARSVVFGLFMAFLFSGAAAYIALKLGQGIETAIPISILAIGFSAMLRRKSSLIENVNVLAFGATSGIVVGGAVFVMPAIYILNLQDRSSFFQLAVVPFLGAVLGILFMIPFRRYFVSEMHGKLPFPEGTATNEVLLTGEAGGSQAWTLLYSMGIGAAADFVGPAMKLWREEFTTALVSGMDTLTNQFKAVFSLNTTAAVLGLGYLIGVRYAAIIMAGSVLSFFVLVPLIGHYGNLGETPAEDIFYDHVRYIGIGGIFAAGLISILKMSKVIWMALKQALGQLTKVASGKGAGAVRTDRDIPMWAVGAGIGVVSGFLWFYFRFSLLDGMENASGLAALSVVIALVVSFLFAAVSAWAVAMISITPISGMTLTTLILSAVLLVNLGLTGEAGMVATLLIGGVVCTALSMTGSLVTQFKVGYWLGSTPKTIQWGNILGSVVAAVATTAVMILLAHVYGFHKDELHPNALTAPQPNAMADVVKSIMGGGNPPWHLYAFGAAIAVCVEMIGVSGLAFALGMYLPMSLNSPILVGAVVAWLVGKSSRNEAVSKARSDRGILISSGLIAGGALIGVVAAGLKFIEDSFWVVTTPDLGNGESSLGNWIGLGVFGALCVYLFLDSWRAKAPAGN
jgi:putative OPT family oligopeptide transporter